MTIHIAVLRAVEEIPQYAKFGENATGIVLAVVVGVRGRFERQHRFRL